MTNALCPIETIAIKTGTDSVDLVSSVTEGTFDVTLKPVHLAHVGVYEYEIEATAKGGATGLAKSTMEITRVCRSALVSSFIKAKTFDVPELADASETWPSASTDYVEAPLEKCTHAFTYVNKDGTETPELVLDSATGIFTLTTSPSKLTEYDVIITITTSGAPKDEVLTLEDVKITT